MSPSVIEDPPPVALHREMPQKIVLLGLGNAGKSSIIKTILHEFQQYSTILPTRMVDRTNIDFFGFELVIWDFGGQSQFREIYLSKPMMYFQDIKYLYYIIDSQDESRIAESIDYFLKILTFTAEYSDDLHIFFFFHKMDPDYHGPIDFTAIQERFMKPVLPEINKYHLSPQIFTTSIYTPITVIAAFTQPLLGNSTIYSTLCDTIDSFCFNHDLPFAFLLLDTYELGHFYKTNKLERYINKKIVNFFEWLEAQDEFEDIPVYRIGKYVIYSIRFEIVSESSTYSFIYVIGFNELNPSNELKPILESCREFIEGLKKLLVNAELIRSAETDPENILGVEDRFERERHREEREQLEGLEPYDKIRELERLRELELVDTQRMQNRESNWEEDGSEIKPINVLYDQMQSNEELDEVDDFDDFDEIDEEESLDQEEVSEFEELEEDEELEENEDLELEEDEDSLYTELYDDEEKDWVEEEDDEEVEEEDENGWNEGDQNWEEESGEENPARENTTDKKLSDPDATKSFPVRKLFKKY